MPFIVFIYARRKKGVSHEQFKEHYNNKHTPMVKEITGENFPISHLRYFAARKLGTDETLALLGPEDEPPVDSFTVLEFEDEDHFRRCRGKLYAQENIGRLRKDEEQFADAGSLSMVIIGDIAETKRDKPKRESRL